MADKSNFSPDEWSQVRGSFLTSGLAVSMAEPSGLIGMVQEGFSNAKQMVAVKQDPNANALIKAVIADLETSQGRTEAKNALSALIKDKKPADAKVAVLASLSEVGRILDAKAPADAAAFKAFLNTISRHVAEAASEGGFLGFGGTQVTENERATLSDIERALG